MEDELARETVDGGQAVTLADEITSIVIVDDLLYEAWAVMANAPGWRDDPDGEWTQAAIRWRDHFHCFIGVAPGGRVMADPVDAYELPGMWEPADFTGGSDEAVADPVEQAQRQPEEIRADLKSLHAEHWDYRTRPALVGRLLADVGPLLAVVAQLQADLTNALDETLHPDALWRQVDRQWSRRYEADVRALDRQSVQAAEFEAHLIVAESEVERLRADNTELRTEKDRWNRRANHARDMYQQTLDRAVAAETALAEIGDAIEGNDSGSRLTTTRIRTILAPWLPAGCTCGGRPDEIGGAEHRPGCGAVVDTGDKQ